MKNLGKAALPLVLLKILPLFKGELEGVIYVLRPFGFASG